MDLMAINLGMRLGGGGGGTIDAYTKAETDQLLDGKADLVDGKVPASELPSYVDDTIEGYYYEGAFYEDSEHTITITGEAGKIYIDLTANKSYRWTGTVYVRIDECPAFGETQGTIYEGNKGKANADAIAAIKDGTNIDSFADVEAALALKANTADLGTAAAADTTTSITSGGTGLPTSGTVYTDQQRQDAEIGSLVNRGAKNLFKAEAPSTTSQNGATITDNGDGTYNVTTNGNPTTAAVWVAVGTVALTDGNYVMTGGADSEKCLLAVNDGELKYVGPGTTTISGAGANGKQLYIHVPSGKSISDTLTVKPMICTAEDYASSSEFVSYAPSNRELYVAKADKSTTYTKPETDALVGGKIPKSYYYTTTVSGTSTLEDTGVSYTVPAGDICRITAAIMYNGSAPQKIRLTFKAMTIAETDAIGSLDITVSASGITAPQTADQVVKVYGQWASTSGTNTVLLLVEKLN